MIKLRTVSASNMPKMLKTNEIAQCFVKVFTLLMEGIQCLKEKYGVALKKYPKFLRIHQAIVNQYQFNIREIDNFIQKFLEYRFIQRFLEYRFVQNFYHHFHRLVLKHFDEETNKTLLAKISFSHPMIVMLVLVGIFFACIFGYIHIKGQILNKMLKESMETPITVSITTALKTDWEAKFKASGSLRAIKGIDVTTEIEGMVSKIEFIPGSEVNAGDALVILKSETDIAQLHALMAEAELAKITYERNKLQYNIQAISKENFDSSFADLNNKMSLVVQQAAMLAKKTIKAPFTGRLGISAVNLGQHLNPGDKVVTLQTFDPIYFDFYVPQQIISKINLNQEIGITSDAVPGGIMIGKITAIDPKADPETRNVQVEATIQNPEKKILPGMFAQIEVSIGKPEVLLTLPQTAISFNPYGELVYLVNETGKSKDGKPVLTVRQSFVKVGSARGDQISVMTGIKEGDRVVTAGQNKLKNGSKVVINNTILPLNNPSPNIVNQ